MGGVSIVIAVLSSGFIVKLLDIVWDFAKSRNKKKTSSESMMEETHSMVLAIKEDFGKFERELSANTAANKALLRDKIYYLSGKIKERGYIYQTELVNLNELFDIYKKRFDGNHIDKFVSQVNSLEIKKDSVA